MQYLGGKSKTGRIIAGYLNLLRQPGQAYWEPFVGAGWVLQYIRRPPVYASDACVPLIAMWQALQDGWLPPTEVSEELYQQAEAGQCDSALTAFIGFGCSFGGKWFAGYARGENGRNYAQNAFGSVTAKTRRMTRARPHFFAADFLYCPIPEYRMLIYCDPPYQGQTGYDAVPEWNPAQFWQRVRWLEGHGHTVIVSEYTAPDDFSCVLELATKTDMHTANGKEPRIERLFRYGEHAPLQQRLL